MPETFDAAMLPEAFRSAVDEIMQLHQPSRHTFFSRLKNYPTQAVQASRFLDEFYLRYQAAMHATRVMAYFLPHLDSVELRMMKLQILVDEDGAPNRDTHHFQLRRTWEFMLGRPPLAKDDEFGDLDELKRILDPLTAEFISLVQELYPYSLGSWLLIEGLAHDWIGALLNSLTPHFSGIETTDYFRENYTSCLEEEHAQLALNTTLRVLNQKPALLEETIDGARRMGEGLDALWIGLERLLVN